MDVNYICPALQKLSSPGCPSLSYSLIFTTKLCTKKYEIQAYSWMNTIWIALYPLTWRQEDGNLKILIFSDVPFQKRTHDDRSAHGKTASNVSAFSSVFLILKFLFIVMFYFHMLLDHLSPLNTSHTLNTGWGIAVITNCP